MVIEGATDDKLFAEPEEAESMVRPPSAFFRLSVKRVTPRHAGALLRSARACTAACTAALTHTLASPSPPQSLEEAAEAGRVAVSRMDDAAAAPAAPAPGSGEQRAQHADDLHEFQDARSQAASAASSTYGDAREEPVGHAIPIPKDV